MSDFLQIAIALLWIVLVAFMIFISVNFFKKVVQNRTYSLRPLFKDFRQKMWMTACLGILFLGLYLGFVLLSSQMDPERKMELFLLAYKHPLKFVYLGLIFFIGISVSIILARTIIKYLYHLKNK